MGWEEKAAKAKRGHRPSLKNWSADNLVTTFPLSRLLVKCLLFFYPLYIVLGLYCLGLFSSSSSNSEAINNKVNKIHQPPISSSSSSIRILKPAIHNGLKTSEWEIFDRHELKQYFGCKQLFKTPRPIITKRNWIYFRDLYNQYIYMNQDNNNKDTSHKISEKVANYPVEGAITKDKGRGLIASRDIERGELIFTGTNNTIIFDTGHSWRKFLWHLYHAPPTPDLYPEGFACDIQAWSWIQAVSNEKGLKIVVDIDESSLLNRPAIGEVANIQCGELDDEDAECGMDYYAIKDIKQGDEISCKYSDFLEPDSWKSFEL